MLDSPQNAGYLKGTRLLVVSTIVGQVIYILISPLLTRLYNSSDLGLLGLISAISSIMGTIVTLRYELAIIGAKTDEDSEKLVIISLISTFLLSAFFSIIIFFVLESHIIKNLKLKVEFVPLIFVTTLSYAATYTFRSLFTRQNDFPLVARINIWQGIARAVLQVIASPLGAFGLTAGEAIGRGFGLPLSFRKTKILDKILIVLNKPNSLKAVALEYINFPKYVLPSSLFDTLAGLLLLPVISAFFGLGISGYFALAQRILAAPLALVGTSIADIFHSQIAKMQIENPDAILATFWSTAKLLAIVGLVPALILFFFGEWLFSRIFGSQWRLTGVLVSIMAPWMLVQFVASPLSRIILLSNKQYLKLIYDIFSVATVIFIPVIAIYQKKDIIQTIMWVSIAKVIAYSLYFMVILYICRQLHREK